MRAFLRRYDRLVDFCGAAPGYVVAGIAGAIFLEVMSRNLGLGVLRGVLEGVEYALVLMTFVGTTWLFRAQRHVRVEILVAVLPARARRAVAFVMRLVVLAIVLGMAWASAKAALLAWGDGSVIRRMLTVPEWLPIAVTFFGFALLCIEALRQLVRDVAEPAGRAPDERAP
jgi:TRAP-type C4-dicarboxylate transport system permease small subunit